MISIVLKGVHHAASLLNSVTENHVFLAVQLPDQSEATDPSKFFIILCNGTDNFARITDSYGVARDIFHNNAAAANYHIASNVYSWHHLYACTDPDIISNSYRICIFQALIAALIIDGVPRCMEATVRCDKDIVAKGHLSAIEDDKVMV